MFFGADGGRGKKNSNSAGESKNLIKEGVSETVF
jgi:hypothetical protein